MKLSQSEFVRTAVLTSLALCFTDEATALSVNQIASGRFTPHERYSKMWINELLLAGAVRCGHAAPVLAASDAHVQQDLFILRPGPVDVPLHQFVDEIMKQLRHQLADDRDCSNYLDILSTDVMACECIQYSNFFAVRDNLTIINSSPGDLNLRLLLQENMRDQVFMLLWRAIKKHAEINVNKSRQVSFSDLTQTAFEYNLSYRDKGSKIDSYPWPKQLGMSKLAYIVRLLKG